jgi:hypothetical protein
MLRKREAILVALVVTAFWTLILVLTSDASIPYEICETAKEGTKQAAKECARYNIISFALREVGAHLDIIGALITAVATAFIARYTFTLKKSTDRLWEAGEKQFRQASAASLRQDLRTQDQLQLTRDNIEFARLEFNATHRPKLVIREAHITIPTGRTPTAGVRLIVANAGVGPADIVESFVILEFNETGTLLPLQYPQYANSFGPLRIEGGQGVEREFGSDINFPKYTNEQNRQRNLHIDRDVTPKIWLRGFIVYLDNNRTRRRMSFCRGCDFRTNRFRAGEDPNYEYSD